MIQLSEAEKAILKFWRGYIRTNGDKSVRPVTKYLWKWKEIFMTPRIQEDDRSAHPSNLA